jgi:hypothetical protein
MNATAVVSCPQCLRQYEIDPTTERVIAQCGVCKVTFTLIVPKLSDHTDEAVVLLNELEDYYTFLDEACEVMAKHACAYMAGQGDAITPSSLLAFIERITSDDVCDRIRYNYPTPYYAPRTDKGAEAKPDDKAMEYFINNLAHKRRFSRFSIRSAFAGMLRGIDWTRFAVKRPFDLHCPVCQKNFLSDEERRGKCPRCQTTVEN